MQEQVAIIGAGIGGLTLALYLKKNGIQPVLYESATALEPIGAGIMMAHNAMQIFEDLGLANAITNAGNRIEGLIIADAKGKTITSTKTGTHKNSRGIYNVAIHRGDLQKILSEAVGAEYIHLNKRLKALQSKGDNTTLHFEDDTQANCSIVFGADGLQSKVRQYVSAESSIRPARQLCWRGICENNFPEIVSNVAMEYWGNGSRFGYTSINAHQIYWYAVCHENLAEGRTIPNCLHHFNPIAQKLIETTQQQHIHFGPIADLVPLDKWYEKRICLIGDAAHATTPNLGQGGCQAIEDAYTIGRLLKKGHALPDLFPIYQNTRQQKVDTIVKKSWMIGKISHIENKILGLLRNSILRSAPASIGQKQIDFISNIDYIQ